jgi:hypothetical protein
MGVSRGQLSNSTPPSREIDGLKRKNGKLTMNPELKLWAVGGWISEMG